MKIYSIRYLFGEGFRSIFRHKLMSFASIGVLTACLLLIGASLLTADNVNALIGNVEAENKIIAFLDDFTAEETETETAKVRQELEKIANINEITYVSKEEALAEEKERLGEDSYLLDGFEDENPYPAHFILSVHSLEDFAGTVQKISAIEHVYQVNSAANVAQMLLSFRNTVQTAGIVIFIILVLVSLVIISNTVRISVFSRRREINIMKMVGATDRFIRTPFMVEGVLLGVFSGLLALGLLALPYAWLTAKFDLSLLFSIGSYTGLVPFGQSLRYLLPGFLLAGILTGLLGSTTSLRKHLKV